MKQLLLRVPEDIHRRLAARAAREGRSINAIATEMLDTAADADQGNRQDRLRAKAAAEGLLRVVDAPAMSPEERQQVIESTSGFGAMADLLIADERGRL